MTKHSKIGASSMHRWAACPGSVRLCESVPPGISSPYAAEGTLAHEVAAALLVAEFHGVVTPVTGEFPEDMISAVEVYTEFVRKLQKPGDQMFIEKGFDLSRIHPGCFGTADFVLYRPSTETLYVVDYKHGAGIPVDVVGNEQLQYYGLGALLETGVPCKRVVLTIVQPRCSHADGPIRSWEISNLDLIEFAIRLKELAEATEKKDAPLSSGDHCRFCPAAGICPELAKQARDVAKLEFSPAFSYDPKKLAETLDMLPRVEAWTKAVREFAYREAEAGRTPPGYKLVEKRGTRQWKSDTQAIHRLIVSLELPETVVYKMDLRSPPQIEKELGKKVFNEKLADIVETVSSGTTLVHESDKRPAVLIGAAKDFEPVKNEKQNEEINIYE